MPINYYKCNNKLYFRYYICTINVPVLNEPTITVPNFKEHQPDYNSPQTTDKRNGQLDLFRSKNVDVDQLLPTRSNRSAIQTLMIDWRVTPGAGLPHQVG